VLQTGDFTRLGGTQTIHTDVVVYATSNRNVEQMVQEGIFRADLFYRLNVVEVKVPSLYERREDIPILINHFIKKHSDHLKIQPKPIDPAAVDILQNNYQWKGNVRELENAVLRALIFSKGDTVRYSDFAQSESAKQSMQELMPFVVQKTSSIPLTKNGLELLRKDLQLELSRFIDQQFLERLKTQFNGNISEITRKTGINRTYLYKIMNRAGINPEQLKN
jgi:DNA-binding NtrC family response regulator